MIANHPARGLRFQEAAAGTFVARPNGWIAGQHHVALATVVSETLVQQTRAQTACLGLVVGGPGSVVVAGGVGEGHLQQLVPMQSLGGAVWFVEVVKPIGLTHRSMLNGRCSFMSSLNPPTKMETKDPLAECEAELLECKKLLVLHGYKTDPNKSLMKHLDRARKLLKVAELKAKLLQAEKAVLLAHPMEEEQEPGKPAREGYGAPVDLEQHRLR